MFTNPATVALIAALALVLYAVFARLRLGYAYKIAVLVVAVVLWYANAGSVAVMFTQAVDVARTITAVLGDIVPTITEFVGLDTNVDINLDSNVDPGTGGEVGGVDDTTVGEPAP